MAEWIDKMDAARRQLEAAVDLILDGVDPVPIHTVVSAADQIVSDVAAKRGIKLFVEEAFKAYFKPEHHDQARRHLRRFANFFKHADKDHDGKIELLKDVANDLKLGMTIKSYSQLEEATPIMLAYVKWLNIVNPRIFHKDHDAPDDPVVAVVGQSGRSVQLLFGKILVAQAVGNAAGAIVAAKRMQDEHPEAYATIESAIPIVK
jgi:hypothetical protein